MSKEYAAPALVISGSVVRETNTGSSSKIGESNNVFRPVTAGSVGFYL